MSKAQQEKARRLSHLYAALAHACGKRVDKTLIEHESETPITATIHGTVGRAGVTAFLGGKLNCGSPTVTNAGSEPKSCDLVACMLEQLPNDEARTAAILTVQKQFARHGKLTPQPGTVKKATAFLKTLRTCTTRRRAATLSFYVKDES